jgi:hypothetical protein
MLHGARFTRVLGLFASDRPDSPLTGACSCAPWVRDKNSLPNRSAAKEWSPAHYGLSELFLHLRHGWSLAAKSRKDVATVPRPTRRSLEVTGHTSSQRFLCAVS